MANSRPRNQLSNNSSTIADEIKNHINNKDKLRSFKDYQIRTLVEHAEKFGYYLRNQRLETNQVRKFLDAINRLKADLTEKDDFSKVEAENSSS